MSRVKKVEVWVVTFLVIDDDPDRYPEPECLVFNTKEEAESFAKKVESGEYFPYEANANEDMFEIEDKFRMSALSRSKSLKDWYEWIDDMNYIGLDELPDELDF